MQIDHNDLQDAPGAGITEIHRVATEALTALESRLASGPVSTVIEPGSIKARLAARYDLECAHPLDELVSDVFELLYRGIVHPNHPRHFGLFTPGVRPAGIIADALVALLNPQVGAWWYAPAACEIEDFVLDACAGKIGLPPEKRFAHFTSGGSEANATAVVLALTQSFPKYPVEGLARQRPVFYLSEQAHDSFVKIAHMAGIGRAAVRRVQTDSAFRMDIDDLRQQYLRDKSSGAEPFLIVATAGTTASGAFDPLPQLVEFKQETGLWLHVDAAWGGLAFLLNEFRPLVAGISEADSVTWDTHKVFPVPMGAGMFFGTGNESSQAFSVETGYVPSPKPGTIDLYQHSMQWSRRFIGLKVFLTLAEIGWPGMAALLRRQVAAGNEMREELLQAGFSLVNDSPLPLLCFTHHAILSGKKTADDVVAAVASRGCVWVSSVRLSPKEPKAIRACITNHRTSLSDIKLAVSELADVLSS